MVDISAGGLASNVALFVAASGIVWIAGARLVPYVDAIADRTGIGQAFAGFLLLGGITSLPEIAAVSGASLLGNAPLSLSNLLGSLCINLVLLAVADATLSRVAITSAVPGPATLLQGTLGIIALALTAGAMAAGDVAVFGVGAMAFGLFAFVLFAFWLSSRYAKHSAWRTARSRAQIRAHRHGRKSPAANAPAIALKQLPLMRLCVPAVFMSVAILIAGFMLSQTTDAIAHETGIGSNFLGLVFVGFATALPNLSSIVAAVRLERFEMAISDVFGANLFNLGLILLADALYAGGPILAGAGRFEIVAALLGIILTAIYLMGLLERRDRTLLGMGYDSFAALWIYLAGVVLLYFMS